MNKRAYTEKEASAYTGFSRSTFRQGRMNGHREGKFKTPPFVRQGRSIRYLKEDLDTWLEESKIDYKNLSSENIER